MYTYSCEEYITSQFAVRFDKNGNLDEYQKLEKTVMVVNAKPHFPVISTIWPFHEGIDDELEMHKSVMECIND